MIPDDLAALCEAQTGGTGRSDAACVAEELDRLSIAPDSELAEIALNYNLAMLSTMGNSLEQLIDPCWPTNDMASAAEFVHSNWGISTNYIPITTCEGEGAYLYDVETGHIWDFELANRQSFFDGQQPAMFTGFFEFLRWYLADAPRVQPV